MAHWKDLSVSTGIELTLPSNSSNKSGEKITTAANEWKISMYMIENIFRNRAMFRSK